MKQKILPKLGALCTVFALSVGAGAEDVKAARNTEPWSCRNFDPAPASIVIDFNTGSVLHAENPDAPRRPASLVKMMTALKIFEALENGKISLDDKFVTHISPAVMATASNSRSTWIDAGKELTVRQALLAITVASANNIAVMMAEKLAGSEQAFINDLNQTAGRLGMNNTVFKNASGLPHTGQVTTARDMAKLALHIAERYPQYYHFFSAEKAEFGRRVRHNHNELAMQNDHIDGIKTGFTCAAGYNLATSARKNGRHVIGIVMGSRTPHQRNVKMEMLLDRILQRPPSILTDQGPDKKRQNPAGPAAIRRHG